MKECFFSALSLYEVIMCAIRGKKRESTGSVRRCRTGRSGSRMAGSAAPPFDLEKPRFDQSTYSGRLSHFLQMTDIRLVFTTDEQLSDACAKLAQFKATGRLPEGVSDEEMWRARQVKEATIHPVTNEKMFLPGRMCCFVPSNLPSTVGMLMAQTPSGMLFWHWFNQSVNVMVNYVNRSGADVNISQLSQAYGLAVVSSCSVAIGASTCVLDSPLRTRASPRSRPRCDGG